ncbi:nuclease-related domain-containing protein [Pontibacillus salicampi]|uniref:Nuclease-related domain-containing protein n=1 Tax=Pontibacillus salicampi TaxID=1449801 RepID=A0ABV6LIZ1_9BACI
MAQLLKVQDYISRYGTDPYRYPGRFMQLKHQNWKRIKHVWDELKEKGVTGNDVEEGIQSFVFQKGIPADETELKQYFLDGLLPFQLKWASRTLREKSFLDRSYYEQDSLLRYFIQRFPDTYLLMYEPIFRIKNAPIELDHMLIHPQGIYCIVYLDFQDEAITLLPENQRTWFQDKEMVQSRMLSPLVSLQRSTKIIKSILHNQEIDFPVRQIVLAPNHTISFHYEPYLTEYVGKEQYEQWFERMRSFQSPIKSTQLKAVAALLEHTQTTAVRRPEWEEEEQDAFMNE